MPALESQAERCARQNGGAEISYADTDDIGSQGTFSPGAVQSGY
jgi:hypothetical protein